MEKFNTIGRFTCEWLIERAKLHLGRSAPRRATTSPIMRHLVLVALLSSGLRRALRAHVAAVMDVPGIYGPGVGYSHTRERDELERQAALLRKALVNADCLGMMQKPPATNQEKHKLKTAQKIVDMFFVRYPPLFKVFLCGVLGSIDIALEEDLLHIAVTFQVDEERVTLLYDGYPSTLCLMDGPDTEENDLYQAIVLEDDLAAYGFGSGLFDGRPPGWNATDTTRALMPACVAMELGRAILVCGITSLHEDEASTDWTVVTNLLCKSLSPADMVARSGLSEHAYFTIAPEAALQYCLVHGNRHNDGIKLLVPKRMQLQGYAGILFNKTFPPPEDQAGARYGPAVVAAADTGGEDSDDEDVSANAATDAHGAAVTNADGDGEKSDFDDGSAAAVTVADGAVAATADTTPEPVATLVGGDGVGSVQAKNAGVLIVGRSKHYERQLVALLGCKLDDGQTVLTEFGGCVQDGEHASTAAIREMYKGLFADSAAVAEKEAKKVTHAKKLHTHVVHVLEQGSPGPQPKYTMHIAKAADIHFHACGLSPDLEYGQFAIDLLIENGKAMNDMQQFALVPVAHLIKAGSDADASNVQVVACSGTEGHTTLPLRPNMAGEFGLLHPCLSILAHLEQHMRPKPKRVEQTGCTLESIDEATANRDRLFFVLKDAHIYGPGVFDESATVKNDATMIWIGAVVTVLQKPKSDSPMAVLVDWKPFRSDFWETIASDEPDDARDAASKAFMEAAIATQTIRPPDSYQSVVLLHAFTERDDQVIAFTSDGFRVATGRHIPSEWEIPEEYIKFDALGHAKHRQSNSVPLTETLGSQLGIPSEQFSKFCVTTAIANSDLHATSCTTFHAMNVSLQEAIDTHLIAEVVPEDGEQHRMRCRFDVNTVYEAHRITKAPGLHLRSDDGRKGKKIEVVGINWDANQFECRVGKSKQVETADFSRMYNPVKAADARSLTRLRECYIRLRVEKMAQTDEGRHVAVEPPEFGYIDMCGDDRQGRFKCSVVMKNKDYTVTSVSALDRRLDMYNHKNAHMRAVDVFMTPAVTLDEDEVDVDGTYTRVDLSDKAWSKVLSDEARLKSEFEGAHLLAKTGSSLPSVVRREAIRFYENKSEFTIGNEPPTSAVFKIHAASIDMGEGGEDVPGRMFAMVADPAKPSTEGSMLLCLQGVGLGDKDDLRLLVCGRLVSDNFSVVFDDLSSDDAEYASAYTTRCHALMRAADGSEPNEWTEWGAGDWSLLEEDTSSTASGVDMIDSGELAGHYSFLPLRAAEIARWKVCVVKFVLLAHGCHRKLSARRYANTGPTYRTHP